MKIIDFSIRRPVTIAMIFLATVVFGLVALGRLNVRLLPEISYPTLTIRTEYPDAAPAEVENFVTRPLEEAVGVVSGLRSLRSVSRPGMSELVLEFSWKTQMRYAALDVRDKIDLIQLPREADSPVILRYDPALDPIVRIGVSGSDNLSKMRFIAERTVKKDLESLDGVANARVLGGLEEEIRVELDERRLASYNIPVSLVSARLAQENVNQSGGRLRDKGAEFLLRTENEFRSVAEIAATIVREHQGRRVLLSDLGSVERGHRERDVITRLGGTELVEVDVFKEGDANTVEVADAVRRRVEGLSRQLPAGVKMTVLFDQSRFIKKSINEVRSNALLGALLAVFVLFAFLRDGRSTLIIALSIPISIMATFVMMGQLGVSLNLMSLGGLALGVGMLVDNSIVVLESISRHKEAGEDRRQATSRGAGEVAQAVIASTLTTVSVFLPIVFVEGIAGQVFKDQALTVSVSLIASLVVALMLIPTISALNLRVGAPRDDTPSEPEKHRRAVSRLFRSIGRAVFVATPVYVLRAGRLVVGAVARVVSWVVLPIAAVFSWVYSRVEKIYAPLLDAVLARRGAFLGAMVVVFAVAVWSARFIGRELIPQFSQGEFGFVVELPEGTPLSVTDRRVAELESAVSAHAGVELCYASSGTATRSGSNVKSREKHLGQVNVVLADRSDRAAEAALVDALRRDFSKYDDQTVKLVRPSYFTVRTPVEVHVFGYDLQSVKAYADQVAERVSRIDGVKDVKNSLEYGNPELNIQFDRVRLSSLGLSLDEVSNTVKTKIRGDVPTRFKEREKQVDIRVRSNAWRTAHIDAIRSLVVGEREGRPILLGTVADVSVARGLNRISRISQQRAAIVSANVSGRALSAVSRDISRAIGEMPRAPGVSVEPGGQNEELLSSYRNLLLALLLAVFLVYLVMAAQFESFIHPLIILFTVPLGAIGVIGTLLLFGKPLSVVVFIGVIMLSGIVVNNGIVLIDYINTLRRRGADVGSAIREASRIRLRPIMMTTMTTVLGLLPMALGLGEGAEIRSPMALAVIGGLIGATVLTLLVIPSLYAVVARAGRTPRGESA